MKIRAVAFSPKARNDLMQLYDWIADAAGAHVAIAYIERLEAYCLGLAVTSERGMRRDDPRTGLRILGFEKRLTIAFLVNAHDVLILRLFYGGQSWEALPL
jgi:toxin ParE1/3/4